MPGRYLLSAPTRRARDGGPSSQQRTPQLRPILSPASLCRNTNWRWLFSPLTWRSGPQSHVELRWLHTLLTCAPIGAKLVPRGPSVVPVCCTSNAWHPQGAPRYPRLPSCLPTLVLFPPPTFPKPSIATFLSTEAGNPPRTACSGSVPSLRLAR